MDKIYYLECSQFRVQHFLQCATCFLEFIHSQGNQRFLLKIQVLLLLFTSLLVAMPFLWLIEHQKEQHNLAHFIFFYIDLGLQKFVSETKLGDFNLALSTTLCLVQPIEDHPLVISIHRDVL